MKAIDRCPNPERLRAFLLGLLAAEEVDALEAHVAGCSSCTKLMEGLDAADGFLEAVHQGFQAGTPEPTRPDDTLIDQLCRLRITSGSDRAADTVVDDEPEALAVPGYDVLERLGTGGMGVVYKARQRELKRLVALKMIRGSGADAEQLARFRREAQAAARLRHPHIVQVYEVGSWSGRPYLALEYLEGGSLAQRLAGGPQPARPAAELVATLARAVGAAHQQGVLHRDLKPGNVLLTAEGLPKVADFGLAKWLSEPAEDATLVPGPNTQSGALLGTPSYMAPEQALGQNTAVGPAADVYALGAILYEALTGRPPFQAATVLETLEQVRSQEPVSPRRLQPRLPRDLETICLKCLHKEPSRRYASAEALAEDLERFLAGKPIQARPAGSWERLTKWVRRQPTLAALAAVSGLLLVLLLTGILVHNAQLREALLEASVSQKEAQRQKQQAADSYRRARDTLNRMRGQLVSLRLGEVPQLQELQQKLLDEALTFYEGTLAGADNPDPAVRLDAAWACHYAANIQGLLGRAEASMQNYRRVIELVEGLPERERDETESQLLLGVCYNNLGLLTQRSGRWDKVEEYHRKALAIGERLVQAEPENPRVLGGLAESEHNLGVVFFSTGKKAESEAHFTRAANLLAPLAAAHPQEESYPSKLGEIYANLGLLAQNSGRPNEAIQAYEKVEALLRPVIAHHLSGGEAALTLAIVSSHWALLLQHEPRFKDRQSEALPRFTEAVQLAEGVLRQEPRHFRARGTARIAHRNRALYLMALGHFKDAVGDWDSEIQLCPANEINQVRVLRASNLARAGDRTRAIAEAQLLEEKPDVAGDDLYILACTVALCVPLARSDAKLPRTERDALAERDAVKAVALLRKLQTQGYFKKSENARCLIDDPDLSGVRWRADFRSLLFQVTKDLLQEMAGKPT